MVSHMISPILSKTVFVIAMDSEFLVTITLSIACICLSTILYGTAYTMEGLVMGSSAYNL